MAYVYDPSDVALTPREQQSAAANPVESGTDQTDISPQEVEALQNAIEDITRRYVQSSTETKEDAIDAIDCRIDLSCSQPADTPKVHATVSTAVAPSMGDIEQELDQAVKRLEQKAKEAKAHSSFSTRETVVESMRAIAEARRGAETPPFLWMNMIMEGTLVDIFGRTGVNKSTLVTQILAEYCASHPDDKVLIVDMEMSKRAQGDRIFDKKKEEVAPLIQRCDDRFYRVMIGRNFPDLPSKLREIESVAEKYEAKVIAIDNLTFLEPELEKGKYGQQLMDKVKDLHERLNAKRTTTLICVSHTPKLEPGIPLHETQVGGSMRVGNAFDEIIGIATSVKGTNVRYVKQCKSRETERLYTEKSVLVGTIQTVDGMLQFVTDGTTSPEIIHLREPKQANAEKVIGVRNDVKDLLDTGKKKDACVQEVAKRHGIAPSTVRKYLAKYDDEGKLLKNPTL